jgi:hypothetical protein
MIFIDNIENDIYSKVNKPIEVVDTSVRMYD